MGGLYRRYMMERAKKAQEAQQAGESDVENKTSDDGSNESATLTAEKVESMTKAQIIAELKRLEVDFVERESKDELKAVLLNAIN